MQVSADCPKSLNKDGSRWSFNSVPSTLKERAHNFMFSVQLLEQRKTNHLQCIFEARWNPYCPFHPKPWAAVLGKEEDTHERRLCLLLLPVRHWARGICSRQESTTTSCFGTYTHKSLLPRINVSEVKFIWWETLAKPSFIYFQVLRKSRWSGAPRRTDWICCTTHMHALLITLIPQR